MTTINQEPTMTTPTPPAWLLCDHRGIGLPGCPTCDGRLDPETTKERFALNNYVGFLLATLAHTERAVKEAQRIIEERASEPKEPIGIGPWTRVGGDPPEPWPGMGVTVRLDMRLLRITIDTLSSGITGEWWGETPAGAIIRPKDVIEVWNVRVCVWRR